MKILIVEDEQHMSEILERILEAHFGIDSVLTLEQAIRALGETDYEAILLDLNLPDSSGVETVEKVRRAAGAIPIVVVTGDDSRQTILGATAAGADDYLRKSKMTVEDLLGSVSRAVGRCMRERQYRRAYDDAHHVLDELGRRVSLVGH